jgi:hypothetical protein
MKKLNFAKPCKTQYIILHWVTFQGGISAVGPFKSVADAENYALQAIHRKKMQFEHEILALQTPDEEVLQANIDEDKEIKIALSKNRAFLGKDYNIKRKK